jgi:TorA maturation chaperone TorD
MAYLCGKTTEAFRAKDTAAIEKYLNFQKDFIRKHLGKWVPDLTRDLLDSGKIGFYRGAAKILNGFVKTDMQNIDFLQKSISKA